jgi:hypothetical protein
MFGPYALLKKGAYEAGFPLAASGARPDEPVARVEVTSGAEILAQALITRRQLRPRQMTAINIPFTTPGNLQVEIRVLYLGRGTLRLGTSNVHPFVGLPGQAVHYRDWPRAFVWVAGTALVGWLFVQVMSLGRRRARSNSETPDRSPGAQSSAS